MKYSVECETTVILEIEADSKEKANEIASAMLKGPRNKIDWRIYAKEMKQCTKCGKWVTDLYKGICYDCTPPLPF